MRIELMSLDSQSSMLTIYTTKPIWSERGDSNSQLRYPKYRRLPLTYVPIKRDLCLSVFPPMIRKIRAAILFNPSNGIGENYITIHMRDSFPLHFLFSALTHKLAIIDRNCHPSVYFTSLCQYNVIHKIPLSIFLYLLYYIFI